MFLENERKRNYFILIIGETYSFLNQFQSYQVDFHNIRDKPGTHISFKTEHTGFSTSENFDFRLC